MAAPDGIVWGSIVNGSSNGRKGRLGIYVKKTDSETQSTVNVQVWFWTLYSCSDTGNTLYYNVGTNVTSATTSKGAKSIKHTVATGSGWSTSNQTKLLDETYTYTRGTSAATYKAYAKFSGIDILNAATYANTSYTVPALDSYTISYDKNGGNSTPSSVTKYYGKNITLAAAISRTGYKFKNWNTKADGSGTSYAAGATYSANSDVKLYAQWTPDTYTVTFNANGGSLGSVSATQTKTHDVTLKLDGDSPTRTNYKFLGWSTSKNGSVVYQPGGNYTTNSAITLHAVWELAYTKPRITGLTVSRCDANNNLSDDGVYALVNFTWACDRANPTITIECIASNNQVTTTNVTASGTSGTVSQQIGGSLSTESTYTIRVEVKDSVDYSVAFSTLSGENYAIDFKAGGNGAAFNKPAELSGVLDVNLQTLLRGGLRYPVLDVDTDLNAVLTPGFYSGQNVSTYNYVNCPITSGTFTLEVLSSGPNGQIWQRFTLCDKNTSTTYERFYYGSEWGEWVRTSDFGGVLLWQGVYYMSSAQTATLVKPVREQKNGIVLVFSRYSPDTQTVHNYHFNHAFVHKMFVKMHPGVGSTFTMTTDASFSAMATKYLYIHDDRIEGHDNNTNTGTGASGIKYTNNGFVLRYVIGV